MPRTSIFVGSDCVMITETGTRKEGAAAVYRGDGGTRRSDRWGTHGELGTKNTIKIYLPNTWEFVVPGVVVRTIGITRKVIHCVGFPCGPASDKQGERESREEALSMYPAARCCLRARSAASGLCRLEMSSVRYLRISCALRNEPLPTPDLENAPKQYHPKIHQLVDQIASLTLLEVSDLNELLKKTLNIQDVGMMPMGAMVAGTAAAPAQDVEEEAPVKKEQTHFTVKLTEVNAVDKVKLIKEVKNCVQGVNLVQAKKMVESLPHEIRVNVAKEEAEKMKAALEAAGGKVVLE